MSVVEITTVSIVLPTYNRCRFLPQALESIAGQSRKDWELIVVDDGGTDATETIVKAFAMRSARPVTYLRQENGGPASARNAGIRLASGQFIAFFDSDDTWETHHLSSCLTALQDNPDVDWIYGSFRRIRTQDNRIVDNDVFIPRDAPEPFLRLRVERRSELNIIKDKNTLKCSIQSGLCVGLKVSVARKDVFKKAMFPNFRIGEDQAFVARALSHGVVFGYLHRIHGTANIHDSNISEVSGCNGIEKSIRGLSELVNALESLRDLPLKPPERKALNNRIARELFWNIGYACFMAGRYSDALTFFNRGLRKNPLNLIFWKTYIFVLIRISVRYLNTRQH